MSGLLPIIRNRTTIGYRRNIMSDGGAQFQKLFLGSINAGFTMDFYEAGTSSGKDVYFDETKSTATQRITADSTGMAVWYADGDYRVVVKDSDGNALYDWPAWKITSDTSTMWEGNRGTSYPATVTKNKWQMFALANASDVLVEVGINNGSRFFPITEAGRQAGAYTSLASAVSDIGATNMTLIVRDTQIVSSDLIIPNNINLIVVKGGIISDGGAAVTLTIKGTLRAGQYQIFDWTGSGQVTLGDGALTDINIGIAYPDWWGVDGTADEVQINQAINSLANGGDVKLLPKSYVTSASIVMKGGIRLIGSGIDKSQIRKSTGTHDLIYCGVPYVYTAGNREDYLSIENLRMSGNSLAGKGIVFTHTHYSSIRNVRIANCEQNLKLDYSWTNTFDNIKLVNGDTYNLFVTNESNALTFNHVYTNGGTRDTDYHVGIRGVGTSGGIVINHLMTEGSYGNNMLLIYDTSSVVINGLYMEHGTGQTNGGAMCQIGVSGYTTRNTTINGGHVLHYITDSNNQAFLVWANTSGATHNTAIRDVRMYAAASWGGDFVNIGTGDQYVYETVVENCKMEDVGGTPNAINVGANALRFRDISNAYPWGQYNYQSGSTYERFYRGVQTQQITAFTTADATPSVVDGNYFQTTGTTAITYFDAGVEGQVINIYATASIKITYGAGTIILNGAVDYDMTVTDTLTLIRRADTYWYELARSVN